MFLQEGVYSSKIPIHTVQNRALIRLELPGTNVIRKKDYQKLIKSHPNITTEEEGLNKRHEDMKKRAKEFFDLINGLHKLLGKTSRKKNMLQS